MYSTHAVSLAFWPKKMAFTTNKSAPNFSQEEASFVRGWREKIAALRIGRSKRMRFEATTSEAAEAASGLGLSYFAKKSTE